MAVWPVPALGAFGGRPRLFPGIEIAPGTSAVECREREAAGRVERLFATETLAPDRCSPKDAKSSTTREDFSPGTPIGSVGPGGRMLLELEENRKDLLDVIPVVGIVGLDDEEALRGETTMEVGEEARGDQTEMRPARIVVGLGVVEVDLGHTSLRHVFGEKSLSILYDETDVMQAPLVGAAGGVADHDG